MTMQIKDTIFFNNKFYQIIAVKNSETFFDPKALRYELYSASTACYAGYHATYEINQYKDLIVENLILNVRSDKVHPINKVEPIILKNINKNNSNLEMFRKKIRCGSVGNILYENLNLPIEYSGILFIAESCNKYCSGHLLEYGYHLNSKAEYVNPIELIFVDGNLVDYIEL